ncbi:hypothetical protein FOA52_001573 [Chlamydomonas sp. UWO 241]|nr:hypothetical protein FOA52_001573 [Chlamydomonas sp. UWO 241]
MEEATEAPSTELRVHVKRGGLAFSILNLATARARWRKLKQTLSGVSRVAALAKVDKDEFEAESRNALLEAQHGVSNVVLQVATVKELREINYCQQGEDVFYSELMLKKRRGCRSSGDVQQAIQKWWNWITQFVGTAGDSGYGEHLQITKPVYQAMVVIIQMVLLPRYAMKADPSYCPEADWLDDNKGLETLRCAVLWYADWLDDNKGLDTMGYPNFYDALFELADMWCDTVWSGAYAKLLNGLLDDVRAHADMFAKLLKRFGHVQPTHNLPSPCVSAAAAAPPPKPLPRHEAAAKWSRPEAAPRPQPLELPPERPLHAPQTSVGVCSLGLSDASNQRPFERWRPAGWLDVYLVSAHTASSRDTAADAAPGAGLPHGATAGGARGSSARGDGPRSGGARGGGAAGGGAFKVSKVQVPRIQ